MPRALVYIVPVALAIYALIELSRSEPVERAELHPVAWVGIIVLVPVIGPILWILISRSRRRATGGPAGASGGTARGRSAPTGSRGPLAPDDDPDFLWRLERDRRRTAGSRDEAGGPLDAGPDPHPGPATTPDGHGAPATPPPPDGDPDAAEGRAETDDPLPGGPVPDDPADRAGDGTTGPPRP